MLYKKFFRPFSFLPALMIFFFFFSNFFNKGIVKRVSALSACKYATYEKLTFIFTNMLNWQIFTTFYLDSLLTLFFYLLLLTICYINGCQIVLVYFIFFLFFFNTSSTFRLNL